MEESGDFKTKKQLEIEAAVTNGVGFKDNPRSPSIRLDGEITLLHLRAYLSAMQADVSLTTESPKDYLEALGYFGDLGNISNSFYSEKFNLNTSQGIEDAITYSRLKNHPYWENTHFDAA